MGMYCKICEYDLRGQEAPRCPECGTYYDPADPNSFLEYPGRLFRVGVLLGAMRIPLIVLLTCLWAFFMLVGPDAFKHHREVDYRQPAPAMYLKMITRQWGLWQKVDPTIRHFDKTMALRDLPRMLGTYVKLERAERRKRIWWAARVIPYPAVVTAIYALLIIPLLHKKRRRIALGVLMVCVVLIPGSIGASKLSAILLPEGPLPAKSHAYLDDYVYLDGVQFIPLADVNRSTTIVAYEKRIAGKNGTRYISFDDGHVERVRGDRARALFEAQGLEYPTNAKARTGE